MNIREIRQALALSLVGAVVELQMKGQDSLGECEVTNRVATLGRAGNTVLTMRVRASGEEITLDRRAQEDAIEMLKIVTPVVRENAPAPAKEPSKAELAAQVATLTAENFALRQELAALRGEPVAVASEAAPSDEVAQLEASPEAPAAEEVAEAAPVAESA